MSDHDVEYLAILKIQRIVHAYIAESGGKLWMPESDRSGPNPYGGQTASGLLLQCDGLPNKLWTPWGLYWIAGGVGVGNWEPVILELRNRLGASMVRAGSHGGDVFALSRVDEEPLPDAVVRQRGDLLSYEESKTRWATTQARFGAER